MPISIESNGRISFSGLSSGIDFKAAVDAIISARRIPIDSLETRIDANQGKIDAYNDLRALLGTLKDAMNKLRGAVTLGDADNVFKGKSVFASTSRTDSAIPSQAGNLLGVTVTNAAAIGPHTVEISRIATSHKIGSRNFTNLTDDLGTASGGAAGSISGSFNIGSKTISVLATDKLTDLRDRINAANAGATATGVTASIVTVSASQNILVLSKDATASNITIGTEVGGVLSSLGISTDGGVTFANTLQTAQTAQFYADGILDSSKWQSKLVVDPATAVSTYAGVTAGAHSFNILDANGAVLKTVNYTDASTLNSLAAAITDAGLGLSATVISEAGQSRLQVVRTGAPDNAVSFATDTNNLLTGLTFSKQRLLFERNSNTVTDLFGGTTLTLYGAELGTAIKLDVDRDLSGVQSAITAFVDAYNEVRTFVNTQTQTDSVTGTRSENAGPLFGSRTLSAISDSLSRILGTDTKGVSTSYSVLAQIGVNLVNNSTLSDPLLADTLTVDATKLNAVLLSNPEDVRKLFSFDFSASDSRVS
ncbi:MAG: flagellar filament capping protein FliD, partial [Dongiaceae bacterium]